MSALPFVPKASSDFIGLHCEKKPTDLKAGRIAFRHAVKLAESMRN